MTAARGRWRGCGGRILGGFWNEAHRLPSGGLEIGAFRRAEGAHVIALQSSASSVLFDVHRTLENDPMVLSVSAHTYIGNPVPGKSDAC